MKTTLICLAIALLHFVLTAQEVVVPSAKSKEQRTASPLTLSSSLHYHWLSITFHGHKGTEWDPCYTSLLSDPKPIVKKLPSGKYEITFTSEIAQDLP